MNLKDKMEQKKARSPRSTFSRVVVQNIQSERDELLRTVENLRERLESVRAGKESLASELKATQEREIRELQTSADLERRVRDLTRENEALNARIDDLQAQVRTIATAPILPRSE